MAILLLSQRASLLKFSDDITRISKNIKNFNRRIDEVLRDVENLYSSFIRFEATIHFVEVTPQEQGIEMYNMAYKNMRIGEIAEKIRYKIEKIHEFIQLKDAQRRNKVIFFLEVIAVILPVISIVSAITSITWRLIIAIIILFIIFIITKFTRGRK